MVGIASLQVMKIHVDSCLRDELRSRYANCSVVCWLWLTSVFFSSRFVSLILQRMIRYRTCMRTWRMYRIYIYSYPVPCVNGLGIINWGRIRRSVFLAKSVNVWLNCQKMSLLLWLPGKIQYFSFLGTLRTCTSVFGTPAVELLVSLISIIRSDNPQDNQYACCRWYGESLPGPVSHTCSNVNWLVLFFPGW